MRELTVVAENLRLVQRARQDFLDMWSVEHGVIRPMLDCMVDDVCHAIRSDVSADSGDISDPAG